MLAPSWAQNPRRRTGPLGPNATLFVSYEGAGSLSLPTIRSLLESNFAQWGPLANVSIHHDRCFAFVTYAWRCSAELAREAMDGQGLLGSTQVTPLAVRSRGSRGRAAARCARRGGTLVPYGVVRRRVQAEVLGVRWSRLGNAVPQKRSAEEEGEAAAYQVCVGAASGTHIAPSDRGETQRRSFAAASPHRTRQLVDASSITRATNCTAQDWVDDWDDKTDEQREQHIQSAKMSTALRMNKVVGAYPSTDHMFAAAATEGGSGEAGAEQEQQRGAGDGERRPAWKPQPWAATGFGAAPLQQAPTGYHVAVAGGLTGFGAVRPALAVGAPAGAAQGDQGQAEQAAAAAEGAPAGGKEEGEEGAAQPKEQQPQQPEQVAGDPAAQAGEDQEAAWRAWYAQHPEQQWQHWQEYYAAQQQQQQHQEQDAGTGDAGDALPGLLAGYGSDDAEDEEKHEEKRRGEAGA